MLYVTRGGLYYLDTVDHFINSYGVLLSGLVEVLLVAWIARQLVNLQGHVNESSDVRVGAWWTVSLKFITPVLLIIIVGFNLWNELRTPYGGYPLSGLILMGWGVAFGAILVGFVFQRIGWRESKEAE